MNCKSVEQRLSAYLDGELTGTEMMAIRGHLHDCRACEEEANYLRLLKRHLCETAVPEPPTDLADRLIASIREERTQPMHVRRAMRVPVLTFVGVAAASMAVTFVVVNGARPASPRTRVARPSNSTSGLAFEVQRDQFYSSGLDATSGVPIISVTNNGRR